MQGGGGQRGEAREGRGLRAEEHFVGRPRAPLLKEVLPAGGLVLGGGVVPANGLVGGGLWGQVSAEAELLLALLVLHLLQFLRGLHLRQLLTLLTHLLKEAESQRR